MRDMSIIQAAACESVLRAIYERNIDKTDTKLKASMPEPVLRSHIAAYVLAQPLEYLPNLVLPEMNLHGGLSRGFGSRWNGVNAASARYDAQKAEEVARGQMRVSEMPAWPEYNSDSTGSKSCEVSEGGRSGEADEDKTPTQARGNPLGAGGSAAASARPTQEAKRPSAPRNAHAAAASDTWR